MGVAGEVLEEGALQEVASGAEAAEAGDTDGMNFIPDLFQYPLPLLAAHPMKGLCALFGVIKRSTFRTPGPGPFRRRGAPQEEER